MHGESHLLWVLNSQSFSNTQCGFRRHRSTPGHLANLEHHVQNTVLLSQHFVAVFFDLEKAFATTWRHGILITLHRWTLRRRLLFLLSNFRHTRDFRVRL
jgi:hypothetical protein